MFIRLCNGSTFQLIGSDTYSTSIVGTSIAGLVMSEFALANPSAWAYARPVLEENDGWAVFISTPRGRNHCFDMYQHAQQTAGWFCELLTVDMTGMLSPAQLAEARREYEDLYGVESGAAMFRQEYMCSWEGGLLGSFYQAEMAAVRSEGRIAPVEAPVGVAVSRAWDLGTHDDTAIWWFCAAGAQIFILDVYSASGVGLEHYRDVIEKTHNERGWRHGTDYVPHDAKVKELGTGRTRVETMPQLGLSPMLVPLATIDDGINAVRRTLPLCVFHPRCERVGIPALEQHRREWDDEKKCFRVNPLHDWTSDKADAFRYLALGWKPPPRKEVKAPRPTGWRIPPPDVQVNWRDRWGLR